MTNGRGSKPRPSNCSEKHRVLRGLKAAQDDTGKLYFLTPASLFCAVVVPDPPAGAAESPAAATVPSRVSLGKNGVTSNGILSRAEVIDTGAAFTSSTWSCQGSSLIRPPSGKAAIWSSLPSSRLGALIISADRRLTCPLSSVKLLPRCDVSKAESSGARAWSCFKYRPPDANFCAYGEFLSSSTAFASAAASSSGLWRKPKL